MQKTSTELWSEVRRTFESAKTERNLKNRAVRWARNMGALNVDGIFFDEVKVQESRDSVSVTFSKGTKQAAVLFDSESIPVVLLNHKKTGLSWNGTMMDLPVNVRELEEMWKWVSG